MNFQSIEYDVGDVLEILPGQDPEAVDAFLEHCHLDPGSFITVGTLAVRLIIFHYFKMDIFFAALAGMFTSFMILQCIYFQQILAVL